MENTQLAAIQFLGENYEHDLQALAKLGLPVLQRLSVAIDAEIQSRQFVVFLSMAIFPLFGSYT